MKKEDITMNQILALREKRANLWNQTKAFLDSHRGEDGMEGTGNGQRTD